MELKMELRHITPTSIRQIMVSRNMLAKISSARWKVWRFVLTSVLILGLFCRPQDCSWCPGSWKYTAI